MKEFNKGIDKVMDNAGFLEYFFGIIAFCAVFPVGMTYFILVKLIMQPSYKLFRKIWK
tara:strand:+ start:406 stop:579 length:174 start_codon:yes stop_codon:yes gene_type:complete